MNSATRPVAREAMGLHGIKSTGVRSVDELNDPLDAIGIAYFEGEMPRRHVLTSNWYTARKDAASVLRQLEGRHVKILIAHSRGSNVAVKLAEQYEFDLIIFCGAAISRSIDPARFKGNPTCINVFSRSDGWVKLGGWVPFSIFGRAGSQGMTNDAWFNVEQRGDHGDYFKGSQLAEVVELINDPMEELARISRQGRVFSGDPEDARSLSG
jgi:hypothetical protein